MIKATQKASKTAYNQSNLLLSAQNVVLVQQRVSPVYTVVHKRMKIE
jgi:hypothetical protein